MTLLRCLTRYLCRPDFDMDMFLLSLRPGLSALWPGGDTIPSSVNTASVLSVSFCVRSLLLTAAAPLFDPTLDLSVTPPFPMESGLASGGLVSELVGEVLRPGLLCAAVWLGANGWIVPLGDEFSFSLPLVFNLALRLKNDML